MSPHTRHHITSRLAPAWLFATLLGCAPVEPSAGRREATAPAPLVDPGPPSPNPTPTRPDAELERAWERVDVLFDQVVGWSLRVPGLERLGKDAIDRTQPFERRLSFRHGVVGFGPDPHCDPARAKCDNVPQWAPAGGIYLELRAHDQAHAAGAFDALHSIGPLTLEVRLRASDSGLRTALLRELAILAGEPQPPGEGCAGIVEQATTWVRDEQRRRGNEDTDGIHVELEQLTPAHPLVDLDADGTPELVLAYLDGDRNVDHFIYAERDGCLRLVGVLDFWSISGLRCIPVPERPLCDLSASQLMIHGDEQHQRWSFDGTRYVEASR